MRDRKEALNIVANHVAARMARQQHTTVMERRQRAREHLIRKPTKDPHHVYGHIGWGMARANRRRLGHGFEGAVHCLTGAQAMKLGGRKDAFTIDVGAVRNAPWFGNVAVKTQPVDESEIVSSRKEFQIQAEISKCDPGLVPNVYWSGILDDGNTKPTRITAMELVPGTTLRAYEMTHGAVPDRILESLLKRLKKCGVSHGDLHDENILVTPDGKFVIIDMGYSKRIKHVHHYVASKNTNLRELLSVRASRKLKTGQRSTTGGGL